MRDRAAMLMASSGVEALARQHWLGRRAMLVAPFRDGAGLFPGGIDYLYPTTTSHDGPMEAKFIPVRSSAKVFDPHGVPPGLGFRWARLAPPCVVHGGCQGRNYAILLACQRVDAALFLSSCWQMLV